MRARLLLGFLLVAGCGPDDQRHTGTPPDTNQIEKLSTPAKTELDPQEGARLSPLRDQDLVEAGFTGVGCGFRSNGVLLLATSGSDSIARPGEQVIHLIHSSPAGPSGGFFEDRQISISIGRTEVGGFDPVAGAPARATITNRRTNAQVELVGIWACRG